MLAYYPTLLWESLIRFLFIFSGWVMKWYWLPENFSLINDKDYVFSFTQIKIYNDYAIIWTLLHTIILYAIIRKYRNHNKSDYGQEANKKFFYSCLAPSILLNIFFLFVHEVIKPLIRSYTVTFNPSGHLLLKGINHGIFLRNCLWIINYKSLASMQTVITYLGITTIVIIYGWYENFVTAIFYHTVGECIAGYSVAFLTIFSPIEKQLESFIKADPDVDSNESTSTTICFKIREWLRTLVGEKKSLQISEKDYLIALTNKRYEEGQQASTEQLEI